MSISLRQLLKNLKVEKTTGEVERVICGVTSDSRRVAPGMVFVALNGLTADGHDFIPSALDRGAAAIVSARNGFMAGKATTVRVVDTRHALARLSAEFYGHPSSKMKMVGVTGTNGKTSVTFILRHLMESASISTGLIGTIRYEIKDRMIPAWRTTPESAEVQQLLSQMVRSGCPACIMETSSHAIDQQRVACVDFDTAIFTNLSGDHLDYHGDMDSYLACKARLFTGEYQGPIPAASVINIDDPYGQKLLPMALSEWKITYGLENRDAELSACQIVASTRSTSFVLKHGGKEAEVTIPLIGRHNIYNVLAAVGGALTLGISWSQILEFLPSLPSVPGRLEPVASDAPFQVLVDYAHTDDALGNVLRTVREITQGRIHLVFGCGGNRDASKRGRMGGLAAQLADVTYITNDNPRRENPNVIAAAIVDGYQSVRTDGFLVELERERAIDAAISQAEGGDVVLIAGKGHETYQEFSDTVIPFDDRECAIESLEALKMRT